MIGFLSASDDPKVKVKSEEIYFLCVPNGLKNKEIKMRFASLSKLFADKLNVDKVYLHFGKETIFYDYKV